MLQKNITKGSQKITSEWEQMRISGWRVKREFGWAPGGESQHLFGFDARAGRSATGGALLPCSLHPAPLPGMSTHMSTATCCFIQLPGTFGRQGFFQATSGLPLHVTLILMKKYMCSIDSPCSCGHFKMYMTSVRLSNQKL